MTDPDMLRAERARALLEDPLLAGAFAALEAEAVAAWRHSAPADAAARERAFAELRALDRLRAALEALVAGGALAAERRAARERERRLAPAP